MPVAFDFTSNIRAAATAAGRAPTLEQIADLNGVLQALAVLTDDDRRIHIETDGKTIAFEAFLDQEARRFPAAETHGQPAPASSETAGEPIVSADGLHVFIKSGSGARWARRDDPMTKIISGFVASDRAARVHEANRWPNPWREGPNFSRTRQTIIKNLDPARAAILKAEAGH